MENKPVQAELRMNRIYFDLIEYHRDEVITDNYSINFNREIAEGTDNNYRVSLKANIWDEENNTIDLQVRIVGEFKCDVEDENLKKTLIQQNSVAILFPFLRSQITLITTQPDIPPIVLPPMNVAKMFKGE